jgi:hypothetical protein
MSQSAVISACPKCILEQPNKLNELTYRDGVFRCRVHGELSKEEIKRLDLAISESRLARSQS